jgi:uncharacterized membrane protein SpoIIM required for sporulation
MIIDLPRFLSTERPHWQELEALLDRLETEAQPQFSVEEVERFHLLYERAAAALARLSAHADPDTHRFLENLVARAYGEIHESRGRSERFSPWQWAVQTFPQTFRRHFRAFVMTVIVTLVGAIFGSAILAFDPEMKALILPFDHLHGDPAERVALEESQKGKPLDGEKSQFSAHLMTHNTRVSILALALGMTFGAGTLILLFYNGVILGAVAFDYVRAGQTEFLLAWLLPHGSIEIPAILIAGQAGLVLAGALIGRANRDPLSRRLRDAGPDLVTLIAGVALLLIWAGLVEAFLSQYHAPIIPYSAKIAFGAIELALLSLYLGKSGRSPA